MRRLPPDRPRRACQRDMNIVLVAFHTGRTACCCRQMFGRLILKRLPS